MRYAALVLIMLLAFYNVAAAQNDPCTPMANAIYARLNFDSQSKLNEGLYTFLETGKLREHFKKGDSAIGIGISIKGVPFSLNGSTSDEEWDKFESTVKSMSDHKLSHDQVYSIISLIPDPRIAQLYVDCISATRTSGIFLVYTIVDEMQIAISGRYFEEFPESKSNKRAVVVDVSATEQTKFEHPSIVKKKKVPVYFNMVVTRTAPDKTVIVTLNTSKWSPIIHIPPKSVPPAPESEPSLKDKMLSGYVFELITGEDWEQPSAVVRGGHYFIAYNPGQRLGQRMGHTIIRIKNRGLSYVYP